MSKSVVPKFQPEKDSRSAVGVEFSKTSNDVAKLDTEYLKQHMGKPLALGLAQICLKKPRDPVEFLAHYLYKYRENELADAEREKDEDIRDLELAVLKSEEIGTV